MDLSYREAETQVYTILKHCCLLFALISSHLVNILVSSSEARSRNRAMQEHATPRLLVQFCCHSCSGSEWWLLLKAFLSSIQRFPGIPVQQPAQQYFGVEICRSQGAGHQPMVVQAWMSRQPKYPRKLCSAKDFFHRLGHQVR